MAGLLGCRRGWFFLLVGHRRDHHLADDFFSSPSWCDNLQATTGMLCCVVLQELDRERNRNRRRLPNCSCVVLLRFQELDRAKMIVTDEARKEFAFPLYIYPPRAHPSPRTQLNRRKSSTSTIFYQEGSRYGFFWRSDCRSISENGEADYWSIVSKKWSFVRCWRENQCWPEICIAWKRKTRFCIQWTSGN